MAESANVRSALGILIPLKMPVNESQHYKVLVKQEEIPFIVAKVETDEVKEAKRLEVEGVKAAESGNVDKALELLNQAVAMAPEHASSYNNRAQALRLQGDVTGALQDLNKAIELSRGQGKVACQAYTQRGLIKRLEDDEEGCKEDLRNAANLGGQFAKQLLVTMNPYAALCNQMLSEVIGKLRSGEGDLPME